MSENGLHNKVFHVHVVQSSVGCGIAMLPALRLGDIPKQPVTWVV